MKINKSQQKKQLSKIQELYAKEFFIQILEDKIFSMRKVMQKFKTFISNSQYVYDIKYDFFSYVRVIFKKDGDVNIYVGDIGSCNFKQIIMNKNTETIKEDIYNLINECICLMKIEDKYLKTKTSIKNKDLFKRIIKEIIPYYFSNEKRFQIIEFKRGGNYTLNDLYILKKEEKHNKIIYIKDFKIKQPEIIIKQNDIVIVNKSFNESEISTSGLQKYKAKKIFKEYILN